jgi:hypothetical protein
LVRILVRVATAARLAWAWIASSRGDIDELGGELFPRGLEAINTSVDFRQLAVIDGDRVRAGISRRVTGPQTLHERARVFESETHRSQGEDLPDEPDVGRVVFPVTVGRSPRAEQTLRFVEPQGSGRGARLVGQFPDTHATDDRP